MARKLALIVGNSEYQDPTLARLVTPTEDVAGLAEVLKRPAIGAFDEVTALVNQSSTTVRLELESFFAEKKPDDLLLLYFSGHGVRDDEGQLYLAVKDTKHNRLRATAIPAAFITEGMDHSRSRRQVLVLDCCHSGAFAQGAKGVTGESVGIKTAFEGVGFGRVVLTATDATQYAWEGDQVIGEADQSVFTHFIIEGLRTGAADTDDDGRITVDELYDYVYERVLSQNPKQTPGKWSYKQQGEIVIARSARPAAAAKPATLPIELQQALDDTRPFVREGAMRELERLLNGSVPALSQAAFQALTRLTEDDSRRVASAAAEILKAHTAAAAAKEETSERSHPEPARPKAEAEGLAHEKTPPPPVAQTASAKRGARDKAEPELAAPSVAGRHLAREPVQPASAQPAARTGRVSLSPWLLLVLGAGGFFVAAVAIIGALALANYAAHSGTTRTPTAAGNGAAHGTATPSPAANGGGLGTPTPTPAAALGPASGATDLSALVAAAKAEGSLSVIALPHDWCNYGGLITGFKAKYGLTVNELSPFAGSGDQLNAIRANKNNPGPQAPDVIDVGPSFGPQAKTDGLLQPYKVSTWADIPDSAKDADGYWYGDYYGVLAFMVNTDVQPKVPTDWSDLLAADYQGQVALSGDPRVSNQAIQSVVAAGLANAGAPDNPRAGLDYFSKLFKTGNLVPVISNNALVANGQTAVRITWDYNALAGRDSFKGNPKVQVVVPKTGRLAGLYLQAISAYAPHPHAARLWMEYLYSDEGQLTWLAPPGYCHPIRQEAMDRAGKIPADLKAALPDVTGAAFPTLDQQNAAAKIITAQWDSTVGVDIKAAP